MPKIILNVFFDGTDGYLNGISSLTSLLFHSTQVDNQHSFKMGFNGCGTRGTHTSSLDFGGIFTYGLANQVDTVVNKARELLDSDNDVNLVINTYGFSRGGAAVFLLAKKLQSLPAEMTQKITINLSALEPVPGNLPIQSKLDITGHSLSSYIWDVSACRVKNMLVLYTNELLPSDNDFSSQIIADAHAPILPDYPVDCHAEIDVMLGCHKTAQNFSIWNNTIFTYDPNALITFFRFKRFFEQHGTQFDFSGRQFNCRGHIYEDADNTIIELYESIIQSHNNKSGISRPMHKDNFLLSDFSNEKVFLNMHHKQLCLAQNNLNHLDNLKVALTIANNGQERASECCVVM